MSLWRRRTTWSGAAGFTGVTTLHYWVGGESTDADIEAAAVAENTFWNGIKSYFVTSVSYTTSSTVDVLDITSGDIIDVKSVTGAGGAGSAVADALPWQTQGLIRWRTGFYLQGRQLQGKTFLPGFSESQNVGGVMDTTTNNGVGTLASTLLTNTPLAVYSKKYHTAAQVTGRLVPTRWAFLSDRRP
jgi:hypothetical protein